LRDHPGDPRNYWARRGLSAALSAQGNMAAYAAIAEETMELARQSNNAAGLCVAHMMFANLYVYTGNFAASERSACDAARHYGGGMYDGSFFLSGLDIGIHIHLGLMNARSFRGDHRGAEASMHDTLRLAEVQTQTGVLCWAVFWASFRFLIERDFEHAGALAGRAFALATEHGFGFWVNASKLSQGAALAVADPDRAARLIGAGLARLESLGSRHYFHPTYLCFQAEALLRLDGVGEARAAVDRALTISASTGLTWWDAELHRIRAAVIRAEGGGAAAVREALSRAVAIAGEQGSKTFRRRAAADMNTT